MGSLRHVRFGSLAAAVVSYCDVRFAPESGRGCLALVRQLRARSGRWQKFIAMVSKAPAKLSPKQSPDALLDYLR
jgi:hypothetical protein